MHALKSNAQKPKREKRDRDIIMPRVTQTSFFCSLIEDTMSSLSEKTFSIHNHAARNPDFLLVFSAIESTMCSLVEKVFSVHNHAARNSDFLLSKYLLFVPGGQGKGGHTENTNFLPCK